MEDIKRRCNSMVDLSKFISNKKILSKVPKAKKLERCDIVMKVYRQIISIVLE